MPKQDIHHDTVKRALLKDGWTITHDPFTLRMGKKRLFIDLGIARLISAEKGTRKVAVEIKSFIGISDIHDLEQAIGQYVLYRKILNQQESKRMLYLAVTETTFKSVFDAEIGQILLADQTICLMIFDGKRSKGYQKPGFLSNLPTILLLRR